MDVRWSKIRIVLDREFTGKYRLLLTTRRVFVILRTQFEKNSYAHQYEKNSRKTHRRKSILHLDIWNMVILEHSGIAQPHHFHQGSCDKSGAAQQWYF